MAELLSGSSVLHDTPSTIIRQHLIDSLIGVSHYNYSQFLPLKGTNRNWPVFTTILPSTPDNLILVLDQQGEVFSQIQYGHKLVHHGIQILIRCQNSTVGYRKANQIFVNFTEGFQQRIITIGNVDLDYTDYDLKTIRASSSVIPLGRERGADSENYIFSTNYLVCLTQYSRPNQALQS